MNNHTRLFTILVLLVSFPFAFGQEKPKAELVGAFGMIDCCFPDFDIFYEDLLSTNSTGYVVIYRNQNNPIESYGYEVAVKTQFLLREAKNVIFVQGTSEDQTRTELWRVPKDAEKPNFGEEVWDYALPNETKPFIFWTDTEIDEICSFNDEMFIRNILMGNKNVKINVMIYTNSQKLFLKKKREILSDFVKNYTFEPKRLTFFRKSKTSIENVEFWLIPKRNR